MRRKGLKVLTFHHIGASKQLAMVIEGEALLNDGAAIVFFNVFLKLTTTEVGLTGKNQQYLHTRARNYNASLELRKN